MPRELVVGNGTLLVNIDRNLNVRDVYYPHVGLHNHLGGYRNRMGVWVDGQFSWLEDTWTIRMGYRPGTLTTDVHASNGRLGIGLRFNDAVHPDMNLFLRRVSVENLRSEEREVRLFFHQDYRIFETDIGDTAFYHPFTSSIIHCKRDCYILTSGLTADQGVFEYAVGVKDFGGAEGTWRDAEDGSLSMHPIEQGSVDSTVSFSVQVPGDGSATLHYWMAVGRSLEEVEALDAIVKAASPEALLEESGLHWNSWLARGYKLQTDLPRLAAELYERSLLVLQTQIDRCGGILAANDTDIMETARAHYSYVWPRDGALVAHALDMAGYPEPARRFFQFCASILPAERPFFLQKYCPDGTPGATWHPWIADGQPEVPCQQDSTALVLWAAGKHCERWKDRQLAQSIYEDLVAPAAKHMVSEMLPDTRLPKPSYDLWEQRRGVHLFTCCAVYGALHAATKLSRLFDQENTEPFRDARDTLRKAILQSFWDPRLGRFVRSLLPGDHPDRCEHDRTIDASMAGIFLFGVLSASDPRVVDTMSAVYDRLWVRTPVGGMARYEDDYYFQVSSEIRLIPGNPWFVSTLWMADWYIAVARSLRDLEPAVDLIQWATKHASETGLLPEQIHPVTGQPLAVMPLSWSHAAFVSTVLKHEAKVRELTTKKADRAQ